MVNATNLLKRRIGEYPNQGFKVRDKNLWCTLCEVVVNFKKNSVVKKHVSSKQHQAKLGAVENTEKLPVLVDKAVRSKGKWSDMVSAFTSAGVPLYVFTNPAIRAWLTTHVQDGNTLPSESTLRNYLKAQGERDLETTTEECKGKSVVVIADESIDIKNRKILNVLIKTTLPNSRSRLVTTKFLDKCDGLAVSNAVMDTLKTASIQSNQVVGFKTDNARYMLTAGNTLRGLCGRMIHSTCWSHILHLVSEEIRSKFKKADTYISSLKSVLVKAPSRRQELLDCFESSGFPRKLPPTPVITRWCTWLEAGAFHFQHLESEMKWINETEDNSGVMHKLKKIATKPQLKEELRKINDVCVGISSSIKLLESRSIPASDVWLQLKSVAGLTEEVLGLESDKLNAYFNGRHPAAQFWRDVQYFDPRKAASLFALDERETLPETLKQISDVEIGVHEVLTYRNLRSSYFYSDAFNVFDFWNTYGRELPNLSKLAVTALSIPPSSADVERSFSVLRRTLTAQRSCLTEENLGVHLRMAYNERVNAVESPEPDAGLFDDEMSDSSDSSDIEFDED